VTGPVSASAVSPDQRRTAATPRQAAGMSRCTAASAGHQRAASSGAPFRGAAPADWLAAVPRTPEALRETLSQNPEMRGEAHRRPLPEADPLRADTRPSLLHSGHTHARRGQPKMQRRESHRAARALPNPEKSGAAPRGYDQEPEALPSALSPAPLPPQMHLRQRITRRRFQGIRRQRPELTRERGERRLPVPPRNRRETPTAIPAPCLW
jgi:hypothetical protein